MVSALMAISGGDEMEGYIRLWRSLADSPVWTCSTANQKVVLITILLHVRWDSIRWDVLGKEFTIGPGEMFTSIRKLADMAGVTQRVVRTALDRFESVNFLTRKVTHQGMLISVVNWGKYQGVYGSGDTPSDTKKTRRGHTHDTPKPKKDTTIRKKVPQESKEGKKVIPPISPFDDFCGNNEELKEALQGWMEMRKKLKKPLTDRALKLNLGKLHQMTGGFQPTMVEVVNQSTMNGWLSFYPIKKDERSADPFAGAKDFYDSIIRGRKIDG